MTKVWKILKTIDHIPTTEDIISTLLNNRGLQTPDDIDCFLDAKIEDVSIDSCLLSKKEFQVFKKRIGKAIENNETIIIFGDYDVDGICASAILWETIFTKTKNVFPYIPNRVDEGYGLSVKGIEKVLEKYPNTKVIITVDNGIVAFEAVSFAKEKGIDVIVTDHHVAGKDKPAALCILHTTLLCGTGIAWILAKELEYESKEEIHEKLELACLATVADLVPLIGSNRAIVKEGIKVLRETKRLGLVELFKEAGIDKSLIGVYAIGHVIAPRLNASGRIQSAMNALRLLCTNDPIRAQELALMIGSVNKDRRGITDESVEHAKLLAIENTYSAKVTMVAHETYNQGVIGLIASHLVESYYRPAFAIAKGETISKGSARSIAGVNIIELLRSVSHTLVEAGGHPMAAGFSLETQKLDDFMKALAEKAEEVVTEELLQRILTIDMVLPFESITKDLITELEKLEPYGMANPEPIFASENVEVLELRKIGKAQNHLKMKVSKDGKWFDAVAFGMADKIDIYDGDSINIAYTIEENEWKGRKSLQLKIKDLKTNNND